MVLIFFFVEGGGGGGEGHSVRHMHPLSAVTLES